MQSVIRSRRDRALLGWKAWILEDPSVHPYQMASARSYSSFTLFCSVILVIPVGGSGVVADPAAQFRDAKFREAWMPYFSQVF